MSSPDYMRYREGEAYLQLVPGKGSSQLKVVNATQRRPTVVDADAVVVRVRIRVPRRAFEPLQPEATITVPESLVQHPVDVEAVDPT